MLAQKGRVEVLEFRFSEKVDIGLEQIICPSHNTLDVCTIQIMTTPRIRLCFSREDRDHYRRKAAPFPPLRERSPVRREVAHSPHSRSGSSVSSRGYSPDRAKSLPFPSQQGKSM